MTQQPQLIGIVLSVDNDEWYYGRPENRKSEHRVKIDDEVRNEQIVSSFHAKEINELFRWADSHEKDTIKKKRRPLYVDKGFFVYA